MSGPHSWAVDMVLLGVICIIGLTLGLVVHSTTQHPQPHIARLCPVDHDTWIGDTLYTKGWLFVPCRWMKLEQDV